MSQRPGIGDGLQRVDWETLFNTFDMNGMDEDEIAFPETLADEEAAANASMTAYDAIERAEQPAAASDEALKGDPSRRDEDESATSAMVLTRSQAARGTPVPAIPPARAEPVTPPPSEPVWTDTADAAPPTGPKTVEEYEVPVDGQGEAPTMAAAEDLRAEAINLAGAVYPSPASFDQVAEEDTTRIADAPRFRRAAVLEDAVGGLERLRRYCQDDVFFCGIDFAALRSRAWQDVYAINDADLGTRGSPRFRRLRHVKDVGFGLHALGHGPLIPEGIDVDLWCYRFHGEVRYVDNLVAIPDEGLAGWRGQLTVSVGAICWHRAIIPARFRYVDRPESKFL